MRRRLSLDPGVVCAGVFALVSLLLAVIYVLKPIADPDFWWHLKTGQLIFESQALLPADPFNFTSNPDSVTIRERTLLNGYWLWQVVAYGFFALAGFSGIKLLNGLTLLLIVSVVSFSLWRSRVRIFVALPLLALLLVLAHRYSALERPQLFSFIFAAILVGSYVAIRRGDGPSWWLLPVMVLWGNIHGGVIIGVILLVLFALGSLFDYRHDKVRRRNIILWCVGGVAASFLNPCGVDFYLATIGLMSQGLSGRIAEYESTIKLIAIDKYLLLLWLLILLHFLGLWKSAAKNNVADWLVSVFFAIIAIKYLRNQSFFTISMIPMTGYYLEKTVSSRASVARSMERLLFPLLAGLFLAHFLVVAQRTISAGKRGEWGAISHYYPQPLTTFLANAPLRGNIFNDYDWGGFLLWHLYPRYKLFIDSRGIDERAMKDYFKIYDASLEKIDGRYEYELLLDRYDIDIVVMNNEMAYREVNRLLKYLLTKPEWSPVYQDGYGYVLVKEGVENAAVLKNYRINKLAFLEKMLGFYTGSIQNNPGDAGRYLGRGEFLAYIGRYEEAARDFAMVRQLDPDNPILAVKLRQMEKLRDKTGDNSGPP